MKMKMKYIIITSRGVEIPILFNFLISHDTFLDCFLKSSICSAGFFELYSDQDDHDKTLVNTYGKSISLQITSRKEDTLIIQKFLNGN